MLQDQRSTICASDSLGAAILDVFWACEPRAQKPMWIERKDGGVSKKLEAEV